jgi:hypothetical protein
MYDFILKYELNCFSILLSFTIIIIITKIRLWLQKVQILKISSCLVSGLQIQQLLI